MSGYQRFVSYIYEYKGGRKSRNTGFAKVESRNGVCKMQIHLQGLSESEGILEIRGFVREGGWLRGISLGRVRTAVPATEARLMTPADHVGNVDYSMENLAGLWISSEQGGTYLSVWDEEPVDLEKLVIQIPDEEEAGEFRGKGEQAVKGETEESGGEIREQEQKSGKEQKTEEGQETGEEAEREDRTGEERQREGAETGEANQPQNQEEASDAWKAEESAEEKPQEGERKREEPKEETDPKTGGLKQEGKNMQVQEAAACPLGQGLCPNCRRPVPSLDQRWECLCGRSPHVQPFEGEEAQDCIQISPGELGAFFRSPWQMGKNSFLLHGYYNYRHLLLAKRRDGSYFLGVPGILENQERMMAGMFGFPQFRKAREQSGSRSPFGYWCRNL